MSGRKGRSLRLPNSRDQEHPILADTHLVTLPHAPRKRRPTSGSSSKASPGPGQGEAAGDEDVADIGELQALLGILLDHHDGLAVAVLKVRQDLEHLVAHLRF